VTPLFRLSPIGLRLLAFVAALALPLGAGEAPRVVPFNGANWSVEQLPGGTVRFLPDALEIEDAAGCTVWLREKLTAPLDISYEVTVIARQGPHDRVSDLNCFWLASDPKSPDQRPANRTGRFADYDSLQLYYAGMGGNNNTTTRFRRYLGDGTKPLLPDHDRTEASVLLTPNHTYRIRIIVRAGVTEYWRDGERLFSYRDPAPLQSGWFALRTVHSHLLIRNLVLRSQPDSVR
jgi:hypothetical protein